MNWIWIAILVWVIVGTFFYGIEMKNKPLGVDLYDTLAGYIVWIFIFPLVLIYKLGTLVSSPKRIHQSRNNE